MALTWRGEGPPARASGLPFFFNVRYPRNQPAKQYTQPFSCVRLTASTPEGTT
jgi:hypothetical protein